MSEVHELLLDVDHATATQNVIDQIKRDAEQKLRRNMERFRHPDVQKVLGDALERVRGWK